MYSFGPDRPAARSEFVGRDAELALLLSHYKQAEEAHGSTVLIRGEGGIGKSRLVTETARRASAMGAKVLAGHATQFDRGIPYALFGEITANVPTDAPGDVHDRVTELRSQLGLGVTTNGSSAPPQQRRDVLSAATAFVVSLAEVAPLIVICEDLHEADADSALLFMRLARQLNTSRVLLIGCLRPQRRVETRQIERLIEQLGLEGRGDVLDMDRLDRSEVRALVSGLIGANADEALVELVCATSRGNPFFATETTRALFASESIVIDNTKGRLVDRGRLLHLNTALVHRFFQIGTVEASVAKVLSAFGRISLRHLPLVASIADVSVDRVTESFDLLVADHLLVLRGEGEWEFAHSVLREALYDDIGPAEQRRMHGLVASHLASERAAGIAVDITELATHVGECADPGDEIAAAVLAEAGDATSAKAPLVSAHWFEKAAKLLPLSSAKRTELISLQSASMFRGSRPDQAARLGREALERLSDGTARTRTLADTVNSLYICGELDAAIEVIDHEERRFGSIGVPLEAQRANFRTQLGRDDASVEANHAARTPDVSAAELAITMSHDLHRAHLRADGSTVRTLLSGLDRICATAAPHTRFAIHGTVALVAAQIGDAERARRALDAAAQLRNHNPGLSIGGQLETAAVQLAFLEGRWDDALRLIPDVMWDMTQSQAFSNEGWVTLTDCAIQLERGDVRRAADVAARCRWHAEAVRRAIEAMAGRVALANGDHGGGRRRLEEAKERVDGSGFDGGSEPIIDALIEASLANADRAAALGHLATLDEFADRTSWPLYCIRSLLARATLLDDVDAARSAKEAAERFGLPIHRAHASLLLGSLNEEVQANLVSAYHAFDDVGALPWRQRVAAQMRAHGLATPRLPSNPSTGLTETESRLARLVSEGMTNRDIAALMHYSNKTVEVYLTRLYAKTKCRSRLELARAIDRGEIVLSHDP